MNAQEPEKKPAPPKDHVESLVALQHQSEASTAAYLEAHPELEWIMDYFMAELLREKPADVYAFFSTLVVREAFSADVRSRMDR